MAEASCCGHQGVERGQEGLRGWRFRIDEVSFGHYIVEGVDQKGRRVSRSGGDADELLAACRKDAEDIEAAIARKQQ